MCPYLLTHYLVAELQPPSFVATLLEPLSEESCCSFCLSRTDLVPNWWKISSSSWCRETKFEAAFLSGRKRIVTLLTESSCFLFCVGCLLVSEICSLGRKEGIIFGCLFVCFVFWNYKIWVFFFSPFEPHICFWIFRKLGGFREVSCLLQLLKGFCDSGCSLFFFCV